VNLERASVKERQEERRESDKKREREFARERVRRKRCCLSGKMWNIKKVLHFLSRNFLSDPS
jgi:hypothetical protein